MQERAKNLERIARELEGTLFGITHEGSARIITEHERRVAEVEVLRARDGSNAEAVEQLIAQSAAVRDAQLSQLRAKEVEAAEKVWAANERVVASLEAERTVLAQTERERFVAQALSRLSAEATAESSGARSSSFREPCSTSSRCFRRASGSWTRAAWSSTGPAPPLSSTRPRSRS